MKFVSRVIALLFKANKKNPKQKLCSLLPQLLELRRELAISADCPPLDGIVLFFDATSKWFDHADDLWNIWTEIRDSKGSKYRDLAGRLDLLHMHLMNAGRCSSGYNRTSRGETVVPEKVYLGDRFGLFTHPVSYWKKDECKKKGGWGYANMEHLSPFDVVSDQAAKFMRSHRDGMCDTIDWLESYCSRQAKAA